MRVHHIIAVAAVVALGVGAKFVFFPPMKAEANIKNFPTMNILQMQTGRRNMPLQKIEDMTFVFTDGQ